MYQKGFNMKKLLTILLTILLALTLSACSSNKTEETNVVEEVPADRLEAIKKAGVLTVATEGDWSPYTYHDETTGELVGFDVALASLIADKLGVEVSYQETDWESILSGVQTGRYDLAINGVTYTEERAQSFNFSKPYAQMDAVLIVAADNEDIKTFEDLNGKISTNSNGSIYASWAEEYGARVDIVPTFQETMIMLTTGRADASINAISAYNDYERAMSEAGNELGVKIVAHAEPERYVVAAQKDPSTESLINEINNILDELTKNGALLELSNAYFGFDATVAE